MIKRLMNRVKTTKIKPEDIIVYYEYTDILGKINKYKSKGKTYLTVYKSEVTKETINKLRTELGVYVKESIGDTYLISW